MGASRSAGWLVGLPGPSAECGVRSLSERGFLPRRPVFPDG
jgi:hypothetical protein